MEEVEDDKHSEDDSTSESGLDDDEYDPEAEDFGDIGEGTEDMVPPGEDEYIADERGDEEGQ